MEGREHQLARDLDHRERERAGGRLEEAANLELGATRQRAAAALTQQSKGAVADCGACFGAFPERRRLREHQQQQRHERGRRKRIGELKRFNCNLQPTRLRKLDIFAQSRGE